MYSAQQAAMQAKATAASAEQSARVLEQAAQVATIKAEILGTIVSIQAATAAAVAQDALGPVP